MTMGRKGRASRHRLPLWIAALAIGGSGLWWTWGALVPSTISRGITAYKRGDWNEADRLAQEHLRTVKHHPEARRLLARSSIRLGRYRTAQEIYNGLDLRSLEAEDYFLLGAMKLRYGQAIEGRKLLSLALAADPDHADALDQYAKVALQTAQVSEATRAAERLAGRPGWEARGDLHLGIISATDQDPVGAVRAHSDGHSNETRTSASFPRTGMARSS